MTAQALSEVGPPNDLLRLWQHLSPAHQQMVVAIAEAFAVVDQPASATEAEAARRAAGLRALFAEWDAEAAALTPDEVAATEADWEDFKAQMNTNRAPEPPLFV
jgi:hypothetical protein